MAKTEKRVLLFIVEGLSDKVSFEGLFIRFFESYNVQVAVMRCDVTTEVHSPEIKNYLNGKIEEYCSIEKIKKTDIKAIIHLVDMDGAFVPDSAVVQTSTGETEYTEEQILAKNKDLMLKRNENKSIVLKTLNSMKALANIDYRIYYLSRNLEHVLHNKKDNLTNAQKTVLSEEFEDLYADNMEGFLTFIADKTFASEGDYKQTWCFIEQGTNSLKRYCNLHLLFQRKELY